VVIIDNSSGPAIAKAEVRAEPGSPVAVGIPVDVEFVGRVEHRFIEVRRFDISMIFSPSRMSVRGRWCRP